jgi:hypothetical protein
VLAIGSKRCYWREDQRGLAEVLAGINACEYLCDFSDTLILSGIRWRSVNFDRGWRLVEAGRLARCHEIECVAQVPRLKLTALVGVLKPTIRWSILDAGSH